MSTLFIFYGSATGNAEHIAKDLASKPPPSPFTKIECDAMEKYKKYEKAWESSPTSTGISKHGMILITSTTGNGDSPENAGRFVRYLKRKTTVEKQPFQHVAYATLGLGDTNYDQFCATAKIVDKKMMELGGTRIQPLECADEGTGNLEGVVEPWADTIFQNVVQAVTPPAAASEEKEGEEKEEEQSKTTTPHEKENKSETTTTPLEKETDKPSTTTVPSTTNNPPTAPSTKAVARPGTSSSSSSSQLSTTKSSSPLVILYGSATGNAEQIAKDLSATYKAILQNPDSNCYFPDVICCEADQFKKQKLVETYWSKTPPQSPKPQKHGVLIITSTTGNGDVPENAGRFVRFLKRKSTVEQQPFQHVAYATLGLGDTNYDQYCATAKLVDKKMMELGGTRIQPLECADEGTGNLEGVVDPWVNSIFYTITKACRGDGEEEDGGDTAPTSNATTETAAPAAATAVVVPTASVHPPTKSKSTISNSSISSSSSNEEKKMDTMDNTNAVEPPPPPQQKPSTAVGVQILRSLIGSSSSSSLHIPQVDHSSLPSLGTRLSSCELIHHGQEEEKHEEDGGGGMDQRRRSRGYSLVEMAEQMTVSSASSTALHYTIAKPYESAILNARYLTKTSTQASKTVCNTIGVPKITTISDNNDKHMMEATDIYNSHFPLIPSSSKDSSHTTNKDEMILFGQNSKRVIEMTLALPDDYTLEYNPGDSLGLLVPNAPKDVQFVLDMLQRHHSMETSTQQVSLDSQQPITVEEAIRHHIDLGSPLKQNNKRILHYLSQFATHPEEETALRLLASKTAHGEELFRQYVEEQCLTVVDILQDFPSCQSIPLEGLLGVLPGIPPRYYSVSSSPLDKQHSKSSSTLSLTVTFSVVDYVTPPLIISGNDNVCGGKRRKRGVATGYLEILCSPFLAAAGDGSDGGMVPQLSTPPQLKIFPKPTAEFRLPATITTPLVLIGPGTGIAPFMGFLSHRQAEITAIESTDAATSVVEGTWRGDYELEGDDAIPITKTDSSGLNMGIEFRRNQNAGSVDVFFGCRYANHDWLYQKELEHYQTNGTISKLYTAFSRDAGGTASASGATSDRNNVKRSGYVQDIMRNDQDCRSRLINLILKDNASVYVCGDGNAMARDVQAAIVDLLTMGLEESTTKGDQDKETTSAGEKAKKYLEQMKAQERFVLDIWTS